MVDYLFVFLLPIIVFVGLGTSYEDIRYGKIRNNYIAVSIVYALASVMVFSFFLFRFGNLNFTYLVEYGINVVAALFVGFFIWHIGFWSAGDAKLFLAYSMLLPLSVYSLEYVTFFQSSVVIVNTFLPVFVFLAFKVLKKSGISEMSKAIREQLKISSIVALLFFLLSFQWIFQILIDFTGIRLPFLLQIILLVSLFSLLYRLPSKFVSVSIGVITLLRLIFDTASVLSLDFLYMFLQILVIFFIIRSLMLKLSYKMFSTSLSFDKLRPGMIPAESIVIKDKSYKKKEIDFSSFSKNSSDSKTRIVFTSDSLRPEEIEYLRSMERRLGFNSLRVYQTIPFAPFMFAGVILTILFQGSILNFLALLF